jgi:hypothetical protein
MATGGPRRYGDRVAAIESYLRASFPDCPVRRLLRAGDGFEPGVQPHPWGGELFRAEGLSRDYDLAVTDEFLEAADASTLGRLFALNRVAERLDRSVPGRRVWVTTAFITVAALGESPT